MEWPHPVRLEATALSATDVIPLELLKACAYQGMT